tara:strand:+ start:657 stop:935 length:279 start_codon:yes stop_codon:yes gene_type:complete
MIINKKNRSINKAKKAFVKWAKKRGAYPLDIYCTDNDYWAYYNRVDMFIGREYYSATFKQHPGETPKIDVIVGDINHYDLTIKEFKELLKTI